MTRVEAYAQLLMGNPVTHDSIVGDSSWSLTTDRRVIIDFGRLDFTDEFMNFTMYKDGWSLYVKTGSL